jgi:hypothetical protein
MPETRILAPRLPYTTRGLLRAERYVDRTACWLVERRHFRTAEWLWRACRMW